MTLTLTLTTPSPVLMGFRVAVNTVSHPHHRQLSHVDNRAPETPHAALRCLKPHWGKCFERPDPRLVGPHVRNGGPGSQATRPTPNISVYGAGSTALLAPLGSADAYASCRDNGRDHGRTDQPSTCPSGISYSSEMDKISAIWQWRRGMTPGTV